MLDILKAALKVGLASLAGLLGWVVAGKVLALTLGAAGVGLFGLLRQLLQNLTLIGSLNGQQALVQGIASRTARSTQLRFAGSVFHIQILLAGVLAVGLLVSAPRLGPWLDPADRRRLIHSYLGLSLIAMPVIASLVIVIKPWIIRGMFSPALLPSLKAMRWMLIGDFFKGLSWVLGFPLLALNDMKWFLWSEVGFSLGMAGAAWLWLSRRGSVEGLGLIFMALYVVFLLVMVIYLRASHGFAWRPGEVGQFVAGLSLIVLLSVLTWRDNQVKWLPAGLFLLLGSAYLWVNIGRFPGSRLGAKALAGGPLEGAGP